MLLAIGVGVCVRAPHVSCIQLAQAVTIIRCSGYITVVVFQVTLREPWVTQVHYVWLEGEWPWCSSGSDHASRIEFTNTTPLTSLFVHWFIGTCYMAIGLHPIIVKVRRRGNEPRSGTLEILSNPVNAKFEFVDSVGSCCRLH